MWLMPLLVALSWLQQPAPGNLLDADAAKLLLENVPEIRRARLSYRRPMIETLSESPRSFFFQVRSTMTRGGASGLIDNYEVERRSGRVFRGMGRNGGEADSFLLRDLKQHLLERSNRVASPERKVLEIGGTEFLAALRQSSRSTSYSLWGILLDTPISTEGTAIAKGLRFGVLNPDIRTGQPLSGYRVKPVEKRAAPIVEVYLGPDRKVAEIHVEVAVDPSSFAWLFGDKFTTAMSTNDESVWKALVAANPVVEKGEIATKVDGLFLDFPSKGICACVYRRSMSIEPVFIVFYSSEIVPIGETLPDSLHRRLVSCLGIQNSMK